MTKGMLTKPVGLPSTRAPRAMVLHRVHVDAARFTTSKGMRVTCSTADLVLPPTAGDALGFGQSFRAAKIVSTIAFRTALQAGNASNKDDNPPRSEREWIKNGVEVSETVGVAQGSRVELRAGPNGIKLCRLRSMFLFVDAVRSGCPCNPCEHAGHTSALPGGGSPRCERSLLGSHSPSSRPIR